MNEKEKEHDEKIKRLLKYYDRSSNFYELKYK